ncbi:class E sortase [Candidatus Dojkabacteria bacterium]|nr:class E sortase [Candidatus Dojkabacteria bacterium]
MKNRLTLNLLTQLVLIIILGVCVYIILYPVALEVISPIESALEITILPVRFIAKPLDSEETVCKGTNNLFIPTARIKGNIITSEDSQALNQGFWHLAGTGNPETGGNMVITGHRFLYLPPVEKTFYNLDLVKPGNKIYICYENVYYEYLVTQVVITSPDDLTIHSNTYSPTLTLYTCTPKWSNKQRLVVRAEKLNY